MIPPTTLLQCVPIIWYSRFYLRYMKEPPPLVLRRTTSFLIGSEATEHALNRRSITTVDPPSPSKVWYAMMALRRGVILVRVRIMQLECNACAVRTYFCITLGLSAKTPNIAQKWRSLLFFDDQFLFQIIETCRRREVYEIQVFVERA